ncbi:hypothetical protein DFH08DRAFT_1005984 [Mycena albidolilacea]|uniref:Uncharacterized protein n=1 Tax=Mycena albidolilacea TaxID=1033008 RepID=A0AAD7F5G6_9AGAR|nr:hypothetical protein DFH08DRAFT_1005984 [Mycena albidolilacea]
MKRRCFRALEKRHTLYAEYLELISYHPVRLSTSAPQYSREVREAYRERSGNCPLSISFLDHFDPFDLSNPPAQNHPIYSKLLPVTRWLRHIAISGEAAVLGHFLRLDSKDLPPLTTLQIYNNRGKMFDGHPEHTNALQLPTLADLSLSFSEGVDPLSLPVRWSQLTGLTLMCQHVWAGNGPMGGLNVGGVLDVLRRCLNLLRCQIRAGKAVDPRSTINTAPSPCLTCDPFFSANTPFFRNTLPHLFPVRELHSEPSGDGPAPDSSLKADFDSAALTSSQFIELLQCFPGISYLRLCSTTFPRNTMALDDSLLALFYSGDDVLCPTLRNISVVGSSSRFSDVAALAFVKARIAMPSSLKIFQAQFYRPMEVDIMPEFQPLIADGLQVALQYPPPAWKFNPRAGFLGT